MNMYYRIIRDVIGCFCQSSKLLRCDSSSDLTCQCTLAKYKWELTASHGTEFATSDVHKRLDNSHSANQTLVAQTTRHFEASWVRSLVRGRRDWSWSWYCSPPSPPSPPPGPALFWRPRFPRAALLVPSLPLRTGRNPSRTSLESGLFDGTTTKSITEIPHYWLFRTTATKETQLKATDGTTLSRGCIAWPTWTTCRRSTGLPARRILTRSSTGPSLLQMSRYCRAQVIPCSLLLYLSWQERPH